MMRIHLLPETPAEGPAWACAEIRLLRPYRHRSVTGRVAVSAGPRLPPGRLDAVVLQRGGPVGSQIDDLEEIIRAARSRGTRVVVDLDDDLLSRHPAAEAEAIVKLLRPKLRFLVREADLVTVSTTALAGRLSHLNAHISVWENAIDETLVTNTSDGTGAQIGYFGTHSHLHDLLSVAPAIEAAAIRFGQRPSLELCGISHDPRIAQLMRHGCDVTMRDPQGDYSRFHTMLATQARWRLGLAPLLRGTFNDSKSDIKVLDYAAAGIPAIVSDVPAYAGWEHERTVLRVADDRFGEAALRLLEDDGLRRRLAAAARETLLQSRTLASRAAQLIDLVETALATQPA